MTNLMNETYSASDLAIVAQTKWPNRYSNKNSACVSVNWAASSLNCKDFFDPDKKKNRQYSKDDAIEILNYLESHYDKNREVGKDYEVDNEEPYILGFWGSQTKSSKMKGTYIHVSIQKAGSNKPRLNFGLNGNSYKLLFGKSREATVYCLSEDKLAVIPHAIKGQYAWGITATKGSQYKFAPTFKSSAQASLYRYFEGDYLVEDLYQEEIPIGKGESAKAWIFTAHTEGEES